MKRLLLSTALIFICISLMGFTVTATINPYYLLAREICGDKAEVYLLIGPGSNPHIFSPKPSDVKILESSDIIIANGIMLEGFVLVNLKQIDSEKNNVFFAGNSIPDGFFKEEEDRTLVYKSSEPLGNPKPEDAPINPHLWLSVKLMTKFIIPEFLDFLCASYPNDREYFISRAQKIIDSLNEYLLLKKEYFEAYKGKKVIVSHASFEYFFNDIGIELLPVTSGHGEEPSMKELLNIIKEAEKGIVAGIFGELQQNFKPIEIIQKETGLKAGVLDPLGESLNSITDLFDYNFKIVVEVFSANE